MAGFRIPQSVAYTAVFKAYLSADHVTAATGKTIAFVISKNTAAFGNPSAGATNATEISNGWYYVTFSATDSGTKGPLIARGTAAGVDDVEIVYRVVDAHNADFDGVPAVVAAAGGGLPTADASNGVKVSVGTGTGQVNASGGKVPATLAAADVAGNLPANLIQWIGNGTTAAAMATTLGELLTMMVTDGGAGFRLTASALANAPTGGTAPTALEVATAIFTDLLSGGDFGTVGSFGKLVKDNLNATISSRSTYAGADTAGTTTLVGLLTPTRAGNLDNLDAAITSRMATFTYAAPDNASVAAIRAKTDNLPADPASNAQVNTRLADATNEHGHTPHQVLSLLDSMFFSGTTDGPAPGFAGTFTLAVGATTRLSGAVDANGYRAAAPTVTPPA